MVTTKMDEKAERIFKQEATKGMVKYNHEGFKRKYKTLYKVILESIKQGFYEGSDGCIRRR